MTTIEHFAQIVRLMRAAQTEFFASHSKEALRTSKHLEKEVDKILKTIPAPPEAPRREQGEIFGT